jgi:hypothetical protein
MTRSSKLVYKSHINYLFNELNKNKIEYDIFMHTWKTECNENIIWENKIDIPINYEEYKLLNPDFYKIENQDEFIQTLNFNNYFNEELYKIYGGDTEHEWRPQLILNHLCALESQKRVYNMVRNNSGTDYDFIIFIRPDVEILNTFDINWLNSDFDITIPNYDHHEGFNDRFAIIPFNNSSNYAERINEIIEFRKNNGRIVSEKYVKFIINKYYPKINFINFIMKIKRPDGKYA